jgi:hypothetical protein
MKRLITSVDLTADDRRRIEEVWPEEADECRVVAEDGWIVARYLKTNEHFERIRRITGYLTGTLDKWNNAKRAEERDRVKHAVASDERRVTSDECGGSGREEEVDGGAADGARGGGVPCGDLAGGARRGPNVVEVK